MKPQIVEIEWLDTIGTAGWQSTPESEPMKCRSVGYLVSKTRASIVVAGMIANKGDAPFGHTITIPRGCVQAMKTRRMR